MNVNTYATFKETKLAIFEFIESWYNNTKIHSTLDYKTLNQKYQNPLPLYNLISGGKGALCLFSII